LDHKVRTVEDWIQKHNPKVMKQWQGVDAHQVLDNFHVPSQFAEGGGALFHWLIPAFVLSLATPNQASQNQNFYTNLGELESYILDLYTYHYSEKR
jgi:hypothetical protein